VEGLIQYLARALVDFPERVELRASDVEGGRLLELRVAPEDIGKVIGRDGRTINAMRTLLTAAAQKKGLKVRLEVVDDRRNAAQAAQAARGVQSPAAPAPEEG
jgi:predicted RNA-binding protein YlqC (UPF0109 family)